MIDETIGYTSEGLTLLTYNQIVEALTNAWKSLFGDEIDLNSNTPDGQLLRIFAEMIADEHDTMRELDSSFNPDTARGAAQDYRYRLNQIERKAGFYTSIPFTFTVLQETTLDGLDGVEPNIANVWGATDGTYNYYLNNTETFTAGTYTRQFTCSVMAAVNPAVDTITQQIVEANNIYVTNLSNSAPTEIGASEESDERYAARRERSTVNGGMNCCDSITNSLLNLSTVANAKAYEHNYEDYPDSTDSDGIPINYIWVIVDGGSAEDIGRAIYENISGTGTKGSQSTTITSDSGQTLTLHYDYAITQNIYLKFSIQKLYSTFNIEETSFKDFIAENTSIDINTSIDSSTMNEIIRRAILVNTESSQLGGVPLNILLSTDETNWVEFLPSAGKQYKYVLLAENITVQESEDED